MNRPNFLFIQSDQHRYDCLGINGHPYVKTPNLDSLAARGMNFSQAYTPCPVCTPARASLMTGQWSFRHGALTIPEMTEANRSFITDLPTVPQALADAGYFQTYVGKWHLADNSGHPQPQDLGFDVYIPESDYVTWRETQGIPMGNRVVSWAESANDPAGFDRMIRGSVDADISVEQSRLHWGADQTIDCINQAASQDAPFFIRWDPSEPHLTNVVPEPFASLYDPSKIQPWGSFGDSLADKPYIQKQQLESWGVTNWTWDDWAPVVARYLGEISLLDQEIGRVLRALETAGCRENTMVVYTSDHGDMCGSHGMMDKHFIMYDDVVRVPLIIHMPWAVADCHEHDGFISHALDLATSICELAGVAVPVTFQGRSLVADLGGCPSRMVSPRQEIQCAYHGAQFGLYSQRMIRDTHWKYIWNPTDVDELYDVLQDPWELHNRAGDDDCNLVISGMRRRLARWMEDAGDPLLNPWTRFQLEKDSKLFHG